MSWVAAIFSYCKLYETTAVIAISRPNNKDKSHHFSQSLILGEIGM